MKKLKKLLMFGFISIVSSNLLATGLIDANTLITKELEKKQALDELEFDVKLKELESKRQSKVTERKAQELEFDKIDKSFVKNENIGLFSDIEKEKALLEKLKTKKLQDFTQEHPYSSTGFEIGKTDIIKNKLDAEQQLKEVDLNKGLNKNLGYTVGYTNSILKNLEKINNSILPRNISLLSSDSINEILINIILNDLSIMQENVNKIKTLPNELSLQNTSYLSQNINEISNMLKQMNTNNYLQKKGVNKYIFETNINIVKTKINHNIKLINSLIEQNKFIESKLLKDGISVPIKLTYADNYRISKNTKLLLSNKDNLDETLQIMLEQNLKTLKINENKIDMKLKAYQSLYKNEFNINSLDFKEYKNVEKIQKKQEQEYLKLEQERNKFKIKELELQKEKMVLEQQQKEQEQIEKEKKQIENELNTYRLYSVIGSKITLFKGDQKFKFELNSYINGSWKLIKEDSLYMFEHSDTKQKIVINNYNNDSTNKSSNNMIIQQQQEKTIQQQEKTIQQQEKTKISQNLPNLGITTQNGTMQNNITQSNNSTAVIPPKK